MEDTLHEEKGQKRRSGWKGLFQPINLLWLLIPVLLWWSFRSVPFEDILRSLSQLHAWQLVLLIALNVPIFLLFGVRWWLLVRSIGGRVGLLAITIYRLAGFGLSYFTPGVQVGGEPFQVALLVRRHAVSTSQAISGVFLDKLLEILSNFTFIILGFGIILANNLLSDTVKLWMWPVTFVVFAFPGVHLLALWRGKLPATWLLRRLGTARGQNHGLAKAVGIIETSEQQIAFFCQNQTGTLLLAILLSALTWAAMLGEYMITLWFIGARLDIAQSIVALTLARVAFLAPLPGGLGALEASQVLAMQVLGYNPALGLTVSLIIRARDILSGLVGMALGGWLSRR